MSRTLRMIDGKGYSLPANTIFRFGCCDCGLTHDMVIAVDPEVSDTVGIAVRRNNRATAARRRYIEDEETP